MLGLLELSRLDRDRLPQLRKRLIAVAKEFAALDSANGEPYILSLGLYPNEVAPVSIPIPDVIIGSKRVEGTR